MRSQARERPNEESGVAGRTRFVLRGAPALASIRGLRLAGGSASGFLTKGSACQPWRSRDPSGGLRSR